MSNLAPLQIDVLVAQVGAFASSALGSAFVAIVVASAVVVLVAAIAARSSNR